MKLERWLPVPGYEGHYDVSDHGRLRSLTHKGYVRQVPKMLAPAPRTKGKPHLSVCLSKHGRRRSCLVANIVAEAFIGPRPIGTLCLHSDGNAVNNHRSNLYYGTYLDNVEDSRRHGTIARGETNGHAVLTEVDVLRILREACVGATPNELSIEYRVSPGAIRRILTRERWGHI